MLYHVNVNYLVHIFFLLYISHNFDNNKLDESSIKIPVFQASSYTVDSGYYEVPLTTK